MDNNSLHIQIKDALDKIVVREIDPKDNQQVKKLIIDVMTEYECIGEDYSSSDPEVKQMFEAYNGDRFTFFVIEWNDVIYGCGGIAPLGGTHESICELRKMYFYKPLRGLGFGRKIMDLCIEKAAEFGFTQMYLETVERMQKANELYKMYGFEVLKSQVGNTGHFGCDSYYVKSIS